MRRIVAPGRLLAAVSLLVLAAVSSAGQVYRWVDADGTVHFSESPPPGTEAEDYDLKFQRNPDPEAAQQRLQGYQDEATARREAERKAAEEASVAAGEAAERRQKCEDARAIVTRLSNSPNTKFRREDGSYERYGDDEREAKIAEAQAAVAEFCN